MIAIVGGSIAAFVAYKTIKSIDPSLEVKVFSKESHKPYGKMLFPYMLTTTVESNMFYEIPDSDIALNTEIIKIDPDSRLLYDSKKNSYAFSKLIVATGADAKKPDFDIDGVEDRVFTVRYLNDIEKIRKMIKQANLKHVVVYGGGLVSLEMANALALAGFKTTILVSSNRILSQILNKKASDIIERYITTTFPVEILKEVKIECIERYGDTALVKLNNKKTIECDFVLVGKGVKPNISMLENLIKSKDGVETNLQLKVTDNIYAAGDLVKCDDVVLNKKVVHAIWPTAVEQAKVAAKNVLGLDQRILPEFIRNILSVFGLNIFTGGLSKKEEYDTVIEDVSDGYNRLLIKNGCLDGFIFTRIPKNSGIYTFIARRRINIEGLEKKLLYGCLDPRKFI